MNFELFQKNIGYNFKNVKLLENALSHTSYAHEMQHKIKNNERLEFLGDTILNFAVSDKIYRRVPEISEGNMSKIRATIICEECLYEIALKLKYDEAILVGKGEERLGGRKKPSILSDAFEAVIAAIYLDSDFNTACEFVVRVLDDEIQKAITSVGEKDHKTKLQEILQGISEEKISYEIIEESGPDHRKKYVSVVKLGNKVLGQGSGNNKKESEQEAANEALKHI